MQLELVVRDGAAQVAFDLLARAGDLAHLRIEETIAVAAGGFRPIEREIRHFQQIVGLGVVLECRRNADAGADTDIAPVDLERLAQHLDDAVRQRLGGTELVALAGLNDGEFVAAEPGQNIGLAQQRFQTGRHFDQQGIAGGMAERIVDLFETIEVQQENGEGLLQAALPRRGFVDFLNERSAIGETRQRVMVRQKGDALLGLLPLGDVLDDGNDAFRLTPVVLDDHAAGRLHARPAHRRIDLDFLVIDVFAVLQRFRVSIVDAFGVLGPMDVERRAVEHFAARNAEHGLERPIDEKIFTRLCVLDDDGDRNVLDDRIQKFPCLVEFRLGAPLFGDIDMSGDPTAVGHRPVADGVDVAAAQHVLDIIWNALGDLAKPGLDVLLGVLRRHPGADPGFEN